MPPYTIAVGIPADLLRRRPDIRAAELAALARSAQIGVAELQLYPAISITGTFGGSASTANAHNLSQLFTHTGIVGHDATLAKRETSTQTAPDFRPAGMIRYLSAI